MNSRGVKRSRSRSPLDPSSSSNNWKRLPRGGGETVRLFITNLPYEMKWQGLKDLFKDHVGNDVMYANLYESDGKPSGSGTVELKDREAADKAIEKLDRKEVMGRKIIVREERPKDKMKFDKGGGDRSGGGGGGRRRRDSNERAVEAATGTFSVVLMNQLGINVAEITNQVFVANLDYKVTREKLEEIFRIAGNVIEAEIKMDRDGKSRGMGVVRFEHPIEAVQAISLFTGQALYDRPLYVRMDRWVEPIMQQLPNRLPNGLRRLGVGMGNKGRPLLNVAEIANTLTLSMLVGEVNSLPMQNNLNSGGMGGGMNSGMGGGMNIGFGGGRGGGMDGGRGGGMGGGIGGGMGGGMMIGGSSNPPPPALMDPASNLLSSMVQSITGGGGGMGVGDGGAMDTGGMGSSMSGGGGGMGGLGGGVGGGMGPAMNNNMNNQAQALINALSTLNNNNFLPSNNNSGSNNFTNNKTISNNNTNSGFSGHSDMDKSTTIFIKNLPYSFTTNDLYNRFGELGDIRFAEVKLDPQGNSKGFALLQYHHADSAHRAINNLNGARIDGRPIEVRYDRVG